MANLYLIDKGPGENGLRIAEQDNSAEVVLLQDGIYVDVKKLEDAGNKVYAVKDDVEKRGYNDSMSEKVEIIDYGKLVDLILANKVVNFA